MGVCYWGIPPILCKCRYRRDEVLPPPLRELDDEPELRDEPDEEPDERLDDELRYELEELDERLDELDTFDERDEDVVPPLLFDDELLVTVPDERLVLLPLPLL